MEVARNSQPADIFDFIVNTGPVKTVSQYLKPGRLPLFFLNSCLESLVLKGVQGEQPNYSERDKFVMYYLLSNGADPMTPCRQNLEHPTLFDLAIKIWDPCVTMLFLGFRKYVENEFSFPNIHKYHPVISAVAYQNLQILEFALELNTPEIERTYFIHNTPLHVAAKLPSADITKCLLDHGADLEARNLWYETPLFHAVQNNQVEQVVLLIQYGADFRTTDEYRNNLLHVLCAQKEVNLDLCKLLLDIGCNPNANGRSSWTPLQVLVQNENARNTVECAKLLLDGGAFLNMPNRIGDTVLHTAARNCHSLCPAFEYFLKAGAGMHRLNAKGETFLDTISATRTEDIRQVILRQLILANWRGKISFSVDMFKYNKRDEQFEGACKRELHLLGEIKIENSLSEFEYSLLTILDSDEEQVAVFCRNPDLRSTISEFDEKEFPMYGSDLKGIYDSGLKIFQRDEGVLVFFEVVSKGVLDYYSIKEIAKNIPTEDLEKLKGCLL